MTYTNLLKQKAKLIEEYLMLSPKAQENNQGQSLIEEIQEVNRYLLLRDLAMMNLARKNNYDT